MKNKWLGYSMGIVAYMLISKALKNKESSLSKCIYDGAEKLHCVLDKFLGKSSFSNQEDGKEKKGDHFFAQKLHSEKDKPDKKEKINEKSSIFNQNPLSDAF